MTIVAAPPLSPEELVRYSRHLSLPGVGVAGQERLKRARVLCVGAGGLGSPVALYLAAAGVGTLGLVDHDVVDRSNLQRQIIHGTSDVGRPKTASAAERARDVNPHVHVEPFDTRLTSENALEILRDFDVVVDGTDNFPTRYLVNDACVLLGKPNVYGSIFRFEGQASVFATVDGPCYRCLFRDPPPAGLVPSCAEAGVFGVLPGLIGVVQATETIKLLLGAGETLAGRLLLVDAWRMHFRTIALRRDPGCPACGTRELRTLIDYEEFCGTKRAPAAAPDETPEEITPRELAEKMGRGEPLLLLDVREPYEWEVARIPGARLMPMATVAEVTPSLDREQEVVVHCHHGMRSAMVADWLRRQGFRRVSNLAGGIAAWSEEVDPAVPQY
ncbi:MAG TPA: molybdopterin-synthase adenylyltransferase MoeB [Gemmatimonadaceae bacterium]|nr:molybdopterin-synthase adenylyltransferase MoeB [Gemmatimonadaceae bacterium]